MFGLLSFLKHIQPLARHRPLYMGARYSWQGKVACVARIRFAGTDEILLYQGTPPEQIIYFHQLTRNIGRANALQHPGYHTFPLKLCATYIRKHCRAVRGTSYVLLTLTVFLCLYSGGSAQYVQKNRPQRHPRQRKKSCRHQTPVVETEGSVTDGE